MVRVLEELSSQLEEKSKKKYMVNENLKEKIVLVNLERVTGSFDALLSELSVHELTAINHSNLVEIIHFKHARSSSTEIYVKGEDYYDDQWVTLIMEFKNARAVKLPPIVRALVTRHGHLVSNGGPSNTMMITDRYANVQRLKTLLEELDKRSAIKPILVK